MTDLKDYYQFLESKKKKVISSGFDIDESKLNSNLYDFQKFTVKKEKQD